MFAHGSSVESANRAVEDVTGETARQGGFALSAAAFLEAAQPDLPAAVAAVPPETVLSLAPGYYAGFGIQFPNGKALTLKSPAGDAVIGPRPSP